VHAAEIGPHLAAALTAKGCLGEDLSDEGGELVVCELARRSGATRWPGSRSSSRIEDPDLRRLVGRIGDSSRIGSAGPIHVGPVFDANDMYRAGFVVNAADDPIGTPTGREVPHQLSLKWPSHTMGLAAQRSVTELPHCERHGERQLLLEGSSSRTVDAKVVTFAHTAPLSRRSRSSMTRAISSAEVYSPRSISASASRISAIARGSDKISRVSSIAARSSGEMSTAAGWPYVRQSVGSGAASGRPWAGNENQVCVLGLGRPFWVPFKALTCTSLERTTGFEPAPHLGKVIWHNSATSHFTHLAMFCWAFDLPLLTAMYRYWPRLVRFSWCMHHGFSHHMHHTSPRKGASTLTLEG